MHVTMPFITSAHISGVGWTIIKPSLVRLSIRVTLQHEQTYSRRSDGVAVLVVSISVVCGSDESWLQILCASHLRHCKIGVLLNLPVGCHSWSHVLSLIRAGISSVNHSPYHFTALVISFSLASTAA